MAEYIEREALEKFIESGLNNPNKESAFGHDAVEILTELHHMPAADVEPVKHGRWIPTTMRNGTGPIVRCSVCGQYINPSETAIELKRQSLEPKWCENCGSKMDLE